ncbi:hypothetical protein GDO81_006200 [Engystomops pustulosus]|uniref:Uncharacterized protein n=1 Tax=Engystomops pustulosus TaxID=76066 RepID=A0AAV7CV41_ENGPU|nr:hypothetical protein GDO81_006200 [Engystomops pustulosus]
MPISPLTPHIWVFNESIAILVSRTASNISDKTEEFPCEGSSFYRTKNMDQFCSASPIPPSSLSLSFADCRSLTGEDFHILSNPVLHYLSPSFLFP